MSPSHAEIDIWWIALHGSGGDATLTPEERVRADGYRNEPDRTRFVATRRAMRDILSMYTETDPYDLIFAAGPHGKPHMPGHEDIHFNLTHSNDFAGLAVTRSAKLGLDCEFIRPLEDPENLCRRVCSPHEHDLMRGSQYEWNLFYRIWTRKEAIVKAMGIGLKLPVAGITVLQGLCDAGAIVESSASGRWWVFDVEAPGGYAAACCISSNPCVRDAPSVRIALHQQVGSR